MLGLKNGTNALVDYDPEWPAEFARERQRLAAALDGVALGIEHYGSTAVPGMRAKPILDILVGVSPLEGWQLCRDPLLQLGYDYAKNAGVPGHYIFGRGRGRDATERTHLVHVVEYLGPSWSGNLAFRDTLRMDAALRKAYVDEKERAVAAAPLGRGRYNELKAAFIATAKAQLG
ncbi:MAG: grpB [Devosia sp.]|jgi:GrpB-like predicted nucleotidyltransferase (UPF0157 family)|nr:grpB [Devosia sp.]